MRKKLENFRKELRTHGVKHLWRWFNWHTPSWLFCYERTLCVFATEPEAIPPPEARLLFRLATVSDCSAMQSLWMKPEEVRQRLAVGDICAIALRDGEIISMCWAAVGKLWIKASGTVIDTGPDSFYSYNGYTLPHERGKGMLRGCRRVLSDHYFSRGRIKMYSAVSVFNLVSRLVLEKAGSQIVGETVLLRILGMNFCYCKRWPHPTRRLQFFIRSPDPEARPV